MKRIISSILIFSFSITFIGSSFAEEIKPPEASPKVTTQAQTGPPTSPSSPPQTQMNSAGLSQIQSFSNNVIDDHVDPISGALVVKQTDLVIPGRGGLDLVISRSYNSRRFSTTTGLLSPAQIYFKDLFSATTIEVVKRRLTAEEVRERGQDKGLLSDPVKLNGPFTEEAIARKLKPSEILDRENKAGKSTAFSGFAGHGWGFSFAGSLMALTYSGESSSFEFPASQIIVQLDGSSARFRENLERTGVYYSQEKGNDDIVRKIGEGYVLLRKGGLKYYFGTNYYDKYHCYVGDCQDVWEWEDHYLLTRMVDPKGNEIKIELKEVGPGLADEALEKHSETQPNLTFSFGLNINRSISDPDLRSFVGNVFSYLFFLNPIATFLGTILVDYLFYLGNPPKVHYDEKAGYKLRKYLPITLSDSSGRSLSIRYKDTSVTEECQIDGISYFDQNGNKIAYKYVYDEKTGNLKEVIPPTGNPTKYDYTYQTQSLAEKFDDKGYLLRKISYPTGAAVDYSFAWYNPKDDISANSEMITDEAESNYCSYAVTKRSISGVGEQAFANSGGMLFNSTRDNALAGIVWGYKNSNITDPLNRETKSTISSGVPVQTTDPMGYTTTYDWDFKNYNLRDITVKRGSNILTTQYRQFDDFGNFHTQIEGGDPNTLSDDRTTHIEYVYEKNAVYKDNGMTSLIYHSWIEKRGKFKEVFNEYDPEGKGNLLRRIEKLDGKDIVTQYEYDAYGNVVKQIDPNGAATLFEYGPEYKGAYLTRISKVVGGNTLTATKYYYFGTGLLKTETDFNGNSTAYEYDKIGRMLKKTNADGTFVSYVYNDAGNEIEMRDERGEMTVYKYDTLGRLASVTFPDGRSTSYQYNAVSKIVATTDRAGRRTGYDYDELDRIKGINYPDGSRVEYEYDDSRNTTALTDQLGNTSRYKYDNFGNLIDVTQADGERAMYDYDAIGNMTAMTDPRFLTTKYFYDPQGRLLRTEYPDSSAYQFEHDAAGNPVKKVDANGEAINYTYDEMGRILKSEYRDPKFETIRSYDSSANGKGLLSTMKDPSGVTSFNYDKRGRIVEKTKTIGPNTFKTAFEYDAVGNLLSIKDPVGNMKTYYDYDELNRVAGVKRETGSRMREVVNYAYNPSNTINSITFGNGNAMKYTYDLRDRVKTLAILDKNNNEIVKYNYEYDAAGNLVRHDISNTESFAYGYDKVYRLTNVQFPTEGDHSYKYDPAGNRTEFKYAYGDIGYQYEQKLNQLDYYTMSGQGKVDESWDLNGNLIKEEKLRGEELLDKTEYVYDPEDRLIEIKGNSNVGMVYDGNGMRSSKTSNGETTLYHYDLANNVICETDESGKVKATYIYANGMRVSMVLPNGETQYYLNDPLGSPIMIADKDGNAVQRYIYDPFGTMILSKGTNENKYTFTGKEVDGETGLMYFGARYYDPKVGRFISRDIAGPDYGNGQSLNRYVYCLNNPIKYIDPDGRVVLLINGVNDNGEWMPKFANELTKMGVNHDIFGVNWGPPNYFNYHEEAIKFSVTLDKMILNIRQQYGQSEPINIFAYSAGSVPLKYLSSSALNEVNNIAVAGSPLLYFGGIENQIKGKLSYFTSAHDIVSSYRSYLVGLIQPSIMQQYYFSITHKGWVLSDIFDDSMLQQVLWKDYSDILSSGQLGGGGWKGYLDY